MLPEVRPHVSSTLADQLEHQLGLAPHLEASHLKVEGVAGIAVVAAAHSDGYAATGHLLGLLAALPAPITAGERFWSDLWRSSGTAYLLPVNIKALVLRSLAGEGTALARQILSAVDEMTPPQRIAAGEVIGQALVESDHFPDLKTQVIGELWLRDLELTAWRVLHADRRWDDPAGRKAFVDAWTSV
ncbi:hypothetical protein OG894_12750 [Streptomyces sp. NBC_01724]|uniref:hypothetical protein n=1 Tax=unclassified Streptomyces TaxID=2593676 RepID=UPI0004C7DD75|nr:MULTISPECIES: hypothetical protein [unclassified Streptomyces]WSA02397.1 hypothetical protein OHA79_33880 [Streptomyces sp. NBC_00841]WSJ94921.1 hypothetical protein OG395_18295 [Streptomyces sp. NBC_01320]WTE54548.1 hypothetical protein OG987_29615 [Streptomyces sp. NBC_01620]